MTNLINKLITVLSNEGEEVTFIKQDSNNLIFSSFEPYEEETTILTCSPYINDENETVYEVNGERNGHTFNVTTIFPSDLI